VSPRQQFAEIVYAIRLARVRLISGARVGRGTVVGPKVQLRRTLSNRRQGGIEVGESCDLRDGVIVETWGGDIRLGRNVFIGPYTVLYGHGGLEIGDYTLISMHCRILSSNHTVPAADLLIRSQPDVLRLTRIGRDVWLGAGVTVLGGVTIGDGCVVGAGAVVASNLPAHSIALGVPARVTRSRLT
jgi:acetyltransferase-like isoleucine patch superfamily enzyme